MIYVKKVVDQDTTRSYYLGSEAVRNFFELKIVHHQPVRNIDTKLITTATTTGMLIKSALQILKRHTNIDQTITLINKIAPRLPLRHIQIRPIRKPMNRLLVQLISQFSEILHQRSVRCEL